LIFPLILNKTVYDPTNLTRFILAQEEIDEVCAESLSAEMAQEATQMARYISRPRGRPLRSFSSAALKDSHNVKKPGDGVDRLETHTEHVD
jgi:hypothetical protein